MRHIGKKTALGFVCTLHQINRDLQLLLYLDFLRAWLKDQDYVALAYMTGILPIKKYGTHSALNMFMEYSMTDPGDLAEYFGFTEDEVKALCEEYGMDFGEAQAWYDGYELVTHSKNGDTHYSMYITGRAGTGKSTFLKYLDKIAGKNIVKLAPTGVAAINAGGQTLHSFFKIRPSVYTPDDPRLKSRREQTEEGPNITDYFHYNLKRLKMLRGIETIVIDEISMVRCDTLDVIDKLLRFYRMKPEPFGGVQMIFIGDD